MALYQVVLVDAHDLQGCERYSSAEAYIVREYDDVESALVFVEKFNKLQIENASEWFAGVYTKKARGVVTKLSKLNAPGMVEGDYPDELDFEDEDEQPAAEPSGAAAQEVGVA